MVLAIGFWFRFWPLNDRPGEDLTLLHGRYDVQHTLGEGAFGKVSKALHVIEKEWVAIKTIHDDTLFPLAERVRAGGISAEIARQQLEREIQILRQLEHKNVVKIKEAFIEDDKAIIRTCTPRLSRVNNAT